MGRQIAIAQSAIDEKEMQAFLSRDCELFCLPRTAASPIPDPKPLGESDAQDQIIFPSVLLDFVVKSWRRLGPRQWLGETQADVLGYSSYASENTRVASIEWNRTSRSGDDYVRGRLYLATGESRDGDPQIGVQEKLIVQRLFNRIVSRIRTSGQTFPNKFAPGRRV
jgi:hypothetical protein